MKKIYQLFFFVFAFLVLSFNGLQAQCNVAAPTISGNTLVCASSGIFTLTATGPSSITMWYTSIPTTMSVSTNPVFITPSLTTSTTYYAAQFAQGNVSLTMPAQVTTNTGNTRGYYFVALNAFTITGLRVPTDASMANSNIAVLNLTGGAPPAFPSTTNSFTTLYLGQNIAGTAVVPVNIPIPAGTTVGVLGDRGGVCSYATGSYSTTFLGMNIVLERLGMQFPLSSNLPQSLWTENSYISRVEIYADGLCSSSLTPVTASVIIPPALNVSSPSTLVCVGGPATTLTASGASNYTWSTASNDNTISVSPNTTTSYTLTGSNVVGCNNNVVYEVTVSPQPTINIASSPSLVCLGQSSTLTLTGADTFTWSSGFSINPLIISPALTTTYGVSGTGNNGCVGYTAFTMSVSPLPTVAIIPSSTIICVGQTMTLTASSASGYSWSTGQTSQAIAVTPGVVNVYAVTVTNAAGCSKNSGPTTFVSSPCTGIEETSFTDSNIRVYPNPTNGQLTINSFHLIREIIVKDLSGRIVIEQTGNSLDARLDIESLAQGVYIVEIFGAGPSSSFRVIKN